MPGYKLQRICESIKREIAIIVKKLSDPRVKNNFFDIVKADLSGDMSVFTMYVSSLGGIAKAQEITEGLNSASAFIKKELAGRLDKSLRLKKIPSVKFLPTDYIEYGANMAAKINDICRPGKAISMTEMASILGEKDGFYILTHKYPDGDTLGSAFALCLALQSKGKKAKILYSSAIPQKYKFMEDDILNPDFPCQCVVSVDIADPTQIDGEITQYRENVNVCIDHHATNQYYAQVSLVEPYASSTAEIMYSLIKEMQIGIDFKIAQCLYVGIATDTGCFKYSNVTPKSHFISGELIEMGIPVGKINKLLFDTKTREFLSLQSMILNSIEYFFDNRCAVVFVTKKMIADANVEEQEMEGIASIPRSIEGVDVGVTVRQKGDIEWKVSIRTSEQVSATDICKVFGGGGHLRAAGFTVSGSKDDVKSKILSCIKDKIG